MKIQLHVIIGQGIRGEINVEGSRLVIGRAADCDVRPMCKYVSRHHCELVVDGERILVRDTNSSNGTFVNDKRVITDRELSSGDRISIGQNLLRIQIDPGESREHTAVSPLSADDGDGNVRDCHSDHFPYVAA